MKRLYPRGKVLGGSGTTNWLQFVRGFSFILFFIFSLIILFIFIFIFD